MSAARAGYASRSSAALPPPKQAAVKPGAVVTPDDGFITEVHRLRRRSRLVRDPPATRLGRHPRRRLLDLRGGRRDGSNRQRAADSLTSRTTPKHLGLLLIPRSLVRVQPGPSPQRNLWIVGVVVTDDGRAEGATDGATSLGRAPLSLVQGHLSFTGLSSARMGSALYVSPSSSVGSIECHDLIGLPDGRLGRWEGTFITHSQRVVCGPGRVSLRRRF